jgi:hypothetical protein
LSDPQHAPQLKALGVNTFFGLNHDPSMLSYATTQNGMFMVAQQEEWTESDVGSNPNVVGWYLSDECEQGEASCPFASDDAKLAAQKSFADKVDKYNDGAAGDCPVNNLGCDGRFKAAGFANGILHTDFWSGSTNPATGQPYVSDHIALVDTFAADKYFYTSGDVRSIITDQSPPEWPRDANNNLAPTQRAASYGWMADQQRRLQDPTSLSQPHTSFRYKYPNVTKPQWGAVVETAMPFLGETTRTTITPDQMEGVIWSNIIHEARGLVFFQHNNDSCAGTYSLVEAVNTTACQQALLDRQNKFKAATDTIRSLAPVINSQSYAYDFNNGTDTMLKTYNGNAYIFADIGQLDSPGNKTFTVPGDVTGTTVTVVDEGRTIPVVNGQFTDSFAAEYSHHIYQISMGPADTTAPTVSLTAPTSGATVSGGAVTLSANAADNIGVAGVQFKVDGANVGSEDTSSPYSISWNSASVANGTHTITAVARDGAGNSTTSSSVSVTVSNVPDTTAPTVSLTAPTAGSTVTGSNVTISANASDNLAVSGVQFKLDGANLQSEDTTSPYSITWDSTTASNGTHTLIATARDAAGNSTTSTSVSVTVSNAAANLNIGETAILAADDSGNGNQMQSQSATLSQTATIQSMSFYVATAAGKLRLGIYDATGPSGGPGAKKAETAEITPITGWNTVNVTTPVSLTAGTYWLAYLPSDNNLHFRVDGTGVAKAYGYTYAAMPATFSTSPTTYTAHWSLYASLVTGGSTGPKTGDINGDNSVNITDLSLLLSSYNQNVAQCVTNTQYKCDLSTPADNVVNIFDLSILLSKYGS